MPEYVRLFDQAGSLITGDISPGYVKLAKGDVEQIVTQLPHCRFLFLIRDPAERLWSQINMMVREETARSRALTNLNVFEKLVRRPKCVSYSFQSETIRLWREVAGDRFREFVMERLGSDPHAYRNEIFSYFGIDAMDCSIPPSHNRKSKEAKSDIPDAFKNFLLDYFAVEYAGLKALLGDDTKVWRV